MARHRWLYAWALGSVAFGAASLLVPLYVTSLGGGGVALGLLAGAAAFVGVPGAIGWGKLADRTERPRAIVLFSLGGSAATLAVLPLFASIPLVVAANALLWLVAAAAGPVLTLFVVADVPAERWGRELALLNKFGGFGWAGGLLLGIVWNTTVSRVLAPAAAQRWLFWACALCAGVAALAMARWMPKPDEMHVDRVGTRRVVRLLGGTRSGVPRATFPVGPSRFVFAVRGVHPRRFVERFTPALAAYLLATTLFFAGFAAFFAPLPLYLTDVGYSSDAVFGLYLVSSLGSAAFSTGAGWLTARYDLRVLQAGALGVRGVAIPAVALVGGTVAAGTVGLWLTAIAFAAIGVAWAVIAVTATTIVTRLAPPSIRGEAVGVYTAISAFAGGVGSVIGGALATAFGFPVAFGVAGIVILASAGVVAGLRGISTRTATAGESAVDD